ncbi:MAG: Xaa-Pro peptidase family protein [Oscillospiraceae bacterium]|nr:Xaa-Pro peptidase family protein [Oscillospiraceae bacterium]
MNRTDKIRRKLDGAGLDALMITSETNRRYAVGFHSSAGVILITKSKTFFLTDGRYIEAARASVKSAEVISVSGSAAVNDLLCGIIKDNSIRTLGYEEGRMTCREYLKRRSSLPADLVPAEDILSGMRESKDEDEIDCIRKAQKTAESAFERVLRIIKPGITEKETAAELVYLMLKDGAEKPSFDPIVLSGAKTSVPHGEPGPKAIEKGDFVLMDFGCSVNGYKSDMTRTVAVGGVTEKQAGIYDVVLRAQLEGISAAKAGVPGKEPDAAARRVIENAGYGEFFCHGFGHGTGLEVHETPSLSQDETKALAPGCIVTAEPGIYIPKEFGVRIEDMLLITEAGPQNLTKAPKNLIVL